MRKSMMKGIAAAMVLGTVFQFGGCINQAVNALWTGLPVYVLSEFVTDNDGVFDLFAD